MTSDASVRGHAAAGATTGRSPGGGRDKQYAAWLCAALPAGLRKLAGLARVVHDAHAVDAAGASLWVWRGDTLRHGPSADPWGFFHALGVRLARGLSRTARRRLRRLSPGRPTTRTFAWLFTTACLARLRGRLAAWQRSRPAWAAFLSAWVAPPPLPRLARRRAAPAAPAADGTAPPPRRRHARRPWSRLLREAALAA